MNLGVIKVLSICDSYCGVQREVPPYIKTFLIGFMKTSQVTLVVAGGHGPRTFLASYAPESDYTHAAGTQ